MASQLTSVSDAYSSYAFGYNDAGWLTSEDNSGTPGMPNVVLTHGYNAFGERTSRSDNLGGSTAFTFDQAHRMTGATLAVGTSTAQLAWTYDNADRLTRITRNGAMPGMAGDVGTTFTLDNMDRVTRIAHSSYQGQMMGQPPLHAFDYTWNAASEITNYTGPEGTLNYSYDTTSQLTGASGARSEAYSYDLNGNRTMAGYSIGTGNRLLSDGVYDYQHDNEGNLLVQTRISDGERTEFTWDHRNRLTKALVKDSGGTTIREARFTYDVFDRLIGRWVDMDGAGPQSPVQTWHAHDGANPYADFDSAGSLTNRYSYAAAIDGLMGRMSSSGVVDWYMTDLIGSVRQIVNQMGSTVLHAASYDSFGNIASQTGTGDRFNYAARELEAAIDQYHNRARWYDPDTGRFTSEDPIGFEGGDANLFRYVYNSPTNATDPTGLELAVIPEQQTQQPIPPPTPNIVAVYDGSDPGGKTIDGEKVANGNQFEDAANEYPVAIDVNSWDDMIVQLVLYVKVHGPIDQLYVIDHGSTVGQMLGNAYITAEQYAQLHGLGLLSGLGGMTLAGCEVGQNSQYCSAAAAASGTTVVASTTNVNYASLLNWKPDTWYYYWYWDPSYQGSWQTYYSTTPH